MKTNAGEDAEKLNHLYITGIIKSKLYSHSEKQIGDFFQKNFLSSPENIFSLLLEREERRGEREREKHQYEKH